MSLTRTETDPVTGGLVYYINEGTSGSYLPVILTGNNAKDKKRINSRLRDTSYFITPYKSGRKGLTGIFNDSDVVTMPSYSIGRDQMVFPKATLDKLSFMEGLNGIGTLLYVPSRSSGPAVIDNAVAFLPNISLTTFEAATANDLGIYYE